MSQYYQARRTRNLYSPNAREAFKLSRSKLELFIECPRCFYLDRVLGVGRPPGFPFNLNSAVDALLKKEFDIHRVQQSSHPLQKAYGLDLLPWQDPRMDQWRENFVGVQYLHQPTNLLIFGAVDDIWVDKQGVLYVVDYKSTSKNEKIEALDKTWQDSYKRQMEIYQWLLRHNDLTVSDTGYFVYCNGDRDKQAFDAKLEFDITLIPYEGKADWVEDLIGQVYTCLQADDIPPVNKDCDYCAYRQAAEEVL
ncbi:MAG: PD-(D/E)XK nuclease family protein [Candidatus Komeilibacteria bacterium]